MKKHVKSTVSFFRLLIEHSQREYEPSPELGVEADAGAVV